MVQMDRRKTLKLIAAALTPVVMPSISRAENWPVKPIRVVVPLGAGSTIDIVGRIVLDPMSKELGQTIFVENRGGAAGTIGSSVVAHAEPDGYTLLINSSQHTIVPAAYPNLGYDPARDFVSLAILGTAPNVLIVSPSSDFKSVKDLVAVAKAKPGTVSFSTTGVGSAVHMCTEIFRHSAGFEGVHVPFRGMQEAITEVLAGRVDFCCATAAAALPFIRDGQLRALAVMTPHRSQSLPDIPTSIEAGFPDSDYLFWIGFFARANTPADIAGKLQAQAEAALKLPAVIERLKTAGVEQVPMTPVAFDAQIRREIASNLKLVQSAGLKFK